MQHLLILLSVSLNCTYPSWESPITMTGNFIISGYTGTFKWCYDGGNNRLGKHVYTNGILQESLIYLNTDFYVMCYETSFGSCQTLSAGICVHNIMPQFPFSLNQFENYTNVGKEIVNNNKSVYHWVGINTGYGYGSFAQDQYFDYNNPCTIPIGSIYINEPRPNSTVVATEIFWVNHIVKGVENDCFNLFPNCTQNAPH